MTVGERFKLMRTTLTAPDGSKFSQKTFGDSLQMSRDEIANLENDRNPPKQRTLDRICSKYHVSSEWLLTGEGEMFIEQPKTEELNVLLGQFMKRFVAEGDSDEMLAAKAALIKEILRLTPEQVKGVVDFGVRLAEDIRKDKEQH